MNMYIGPTPTQSKKTKSKAPSSASNQSEDQLSQDMLGMGLEDVAKKAAQARLKVSSATSTPAGTPPDTPRSASPLAKIPASKRVNVMEEYAKRSGEKPKLNLVVIGHVDAGKSTLMGHLLYEIGHVNDRTMKKYERDSQKIGKGSFAYAWVLDETGEERDRGITMDIATNNFETDHRSFTLLDAPGHRDFIPNMISGTAQADAAVLVVDASTGGFESGFEANGQTKEHALLARSLGVQQMIIAVNKLDTLDWDQGRFDSIVEKLNLFLVQAGYRKSNLTYIPVSGLTGENLIKKSDLVNWYSGPSLLELIDAFEPPVRALDKPLRMGVTDFFKGGIGSSGGVSVGGSIDAGHVQVGEQVMVVPGGEIGIVKAMQVNDETSTWAAAGDSVLMTLSGLDIMNLSNGCVICNPQFPVPVTSTFTAQIVVFDIKIPITAGFPVVLHQQSLDEPASIIKLLCTLDKSTGEVTKRNPRHLGKGMTAKVKIQLSNRAIPLETFKQNKQLGRIMLRRGGETIAAGVVDEILTFGS
ncbi:translation elongation factor Tu [Lichtheimia ornata]|uniref:Elongation factor 1 alpha-like protein n=1 Tax=Lichtheimia ornata TaxID=688661 RepID=A0AAD7XTC2_9FUNG|nr:translation elongation factor Tu [Lichtheimia ornata]KAJ8653690.1 translation elongation factor Tu [Lichtheimia ornata]